MLEKQRVFIPVYIFDKETVGVVSVPYKNDTYVKEYEGYFFTKDQLINLIKNTFTEGKGSFAYEIGDDTFEEDESDNKTLWNSISISLLLYDQKDLSRKETIRRIYNNSKRQLDIALSELEKWCDENCFDTQSDISVVSVKLLKAKIKTLK